MQGWLGVLVLWLVGVTISVVVLVWKLLVYRRVIRVLAGYQHELVEMVTDPKGQGPPA